ncbi:XRE family transcriptional regulator [Moraxella bovis]|uniref:Anaerobic benzoate catabolism transcriptional regulator n=1 Tax=Moraxella bovis TaxID=476 RepID=A0A1T0A290_MORBO|nr:LexA family transcriptional regulator [Moraxella bovis]OOR89815.1 hypothetical protein B0182_06580 [Moraxella bovis]STY90180.1 anaerobic benzoate catabolism transcriptional regulator [Moraxella bovis]
MSRQTFGERVRYVRELRGMTQQQLADLAGCGQGQINAIESRKSIQSKYARDIALALNVNLDWLLNGNGAMEVGEQGTITKVADFDAYSQKEVVPIRHYNPQHRNKLMLEKTTLEVLGVNPQDARLGVIVGDSMSPIINDNSEIAFDVSKTQIKNGKIYALLANDVLYCAYLQSKPTPQGEQVRLFYANAGLYPDETMSSEQFFATYKILGHVFWWSSTQSW